MVFNGAEAPSLTCDVIPIRYVVSVFVSEGLLQA